MHTMQRNRPRVLDAGALGGDGNLSQTRPMILLLRWWLQRAASTGRVCRRCAKGKSTTMKIKAYTRRRSYPGRSWLLLRCCTCKCPFASHWTLFWFLASWTSHDTQTARKHRQPRRDSMVRKATHAPNVANEIKTWSAIALLPH